MGSEAPLGVTIHVTGFKKFHGVAENPTEIIVSNLETFMKMRGLPNNLILGSCNILEAAGEGALTSLYKILESSVNKLESETSNSRQIIWVHFGVNSGATRFTVECRAFNEATFLCADQLGWKPNKVPIVPADGDISRTRQTILPIGDITNALGERGYEVLTSTDIDRFVCNYVYYHSLRFAEQHRVKSILVHVPLFSLIEEEIQMEFAANLLEDRFLRELQKQHKHPGQRRLQSQNLSEYNIDASL